MTPANVFLALGLLTSVLHAEFEVSSKRIESGAARAGFQLGTDVPAPAKGDLAAKAEFTIVDGERDPSGGELSRLHDDQLPGNGDDPRANFFFQAGSDGGRLQVDLGNVTPVGAINSYSWHGGARGPQVYKLYGSDGKAEGFDAKPKRDKDPEKAGWKLLATVDTRPKENPAGQYGVSVHQKAGETTALRYLLFDIAPTEKTDAFGNTFFSEIDVLDDKAGEPIALQQIVESVEIPGGYRFTVETTEAPDLTEWAHKDLIPVVQTWYPKIVEMLPSDGFVAPKTFSINFTESYKGVAATAGNRIMCAPGWFRRELKREAVGAVVHELVHVVQQYRGRGRREGARPPGWLVEGMCDYIRWFLYEPQSKGALIRPRDAAKARYDGSYRPTGNFLNFVIGKYDKDFLKEVNAAMREGRYDDGFWKTRTGHTAPELAEEWKKAIAESTEPR